MSGDCGRFAHQRDEVGARYVQRWLRELDTVFDRLESGQVGDAAMLLREWRERFQNTCEWVEGGAPWIGPSRLRGGL
jgi:hypothetical protein